MENKILDWLPSLICFDDFGGDWNRFIEKVYEVFCRDFIATPPKFRAEWVRCRRDPIIDGKEAGFWHCTSEGRNEMERTPDLRRCERIGWVRATIEHSEHSGIRVWLVRKNRELRCYLWLNEEFLVVLGRRKNFWLLITAFCTDRGHTCRKLRKEYERSQKS